MHTPPDIPVLIVDDEPAVAALHARLVEQQSGFEVVAIAHSGVAALQAIERHTPQLILLDFGLPDIDGRELLRRLRASNRADVEVIALTAASDLESVRFARGTGVRHYLVKPFSVKTLAERLERIKQESHTLQQIPVKLDQHAVDAILGGQDSPSAVKPLPKGLGAETLTRVRRVLQQLPGDISAAEMAHAAGLSRVTARRYLEFLVHIGEVQIHPKYGGSGRPENRYVSTRGPATSRVSRSSVSSGIVRES